LVTTRFSFAHRSMAEPFRAPLFDWVQVAPGVRVKVDAGADPTFLMVTVVVTSWPGTIVVEPPNLLMVEQVDVLVDTEPPSVERHVTVAVLFCSCMTREPDAAVLVVLLIEAVNPARVPDIVSERRTAASAPVPMAIGAKRTRLLKRCEALNTSGDPLLVELKASPGEVCDRMIGLRGNRFA
jgi:hypothetical protein